jgi:hypothetical protein
MGAKRATNMNNHPLIAVLTCKHGSLLQRDFKVGLSGTLVSHIR